MSWDYRIYCTVYQGPPESRSYSIVEAFYNERGEVEAVTEPIPPEGGEGDIAGDDGLGALLEEFCYMAVAFEKLILTKEDLVECNRLHQKKACPDETH